MVSAANLLGSDTDTIATMAGAMLGAVAAEDPPAGLLDKDYLVRDASRLAAIAGLGQVSRSFPYPDLLTWSPPRNQVDCLGLLDDDVAVVGLGMATPIGEFVPQGGRGESGWQWLRTWFGQTVFVKRRVTLRALAATAVSVRVPDDRSQPQLFSSGPSEARQAEKEDRQAQVDARPIGSERLERAEGPLTVAEAIVKAENRQFAPSIVGSLIIQLSTETPDGVDKAIAFAALVARELSKLPRKH